MKILIVTGIFPPDIGGPATYVPFLAAELLRRGHAVRVITYGVSGDAGMPYPVSYIPRFPLLMRYFLFFIACVRHGFSADVIFSQDAASSGVPAACAAFFLRKRFICKIVGDFSWEYARAVGLADDSIDVFERRASYPPIIALVRFCQRAVCRHAIRIIVPSVYLKGVVTGWGVDARKISVIYNAVSVSVPHVTIPRQPFLFFSAGRLVSWKGFDGLLRAFARVHETVPAARLVIAGDGPCQADLVLLAVELGIMQEVSFLGRVSAAEMALWYARAGCFVLFSSYEGLSHVMLEALAHGLPVIASDAGGNAELIIDGVNGKLIKSGDEIALEGALVNFLKHPPVTRSSTGVAADAMFDAVVGLLTTV